MTSFNEILYEALRRQEKEQDLRNTLVSLVNAIEGSVRSVDFVPAFESKDGSVKVYRLIATIVTGADD